MSSSQPITRPRSARRQTRPGNQLYGARTAGDHDRGKRPATRGSGAPKASNRAKLQGFVLDFCPRSFLARGGAFLQIYS